jgi:hypothetical protein
MNRLIFGVIKDDFDLNGEFKKNHEEIKNIMMYIRV